MEALNVDIKNSRHRTLIGVGGIGTGQFFALDGSHTLGREESRGGRFLDRRDYCKLHIIAHYVRTLLGADFDTILIGRVGDDSPGRELLREMSETGLDLRHVEVVPGGQTLSSFCLMYPDGSGGNLTTADSASAAVDAGLVRQAAPLFAATPDKGIVLAAPEVPMPARQHLLELGAGHGWFRVASLTSQEIASPQAPDMLRLVDLLAMNLDEAASLARLADSSGDVQQTVRAAIDTARLHQPAMLISITAGRHGSWTWDGHQVRHVAAVAVEAISTAGAGDAHLAGLISGMVAGLSLQQSHELANIVSALSVTSPHTIHPTLDRASLREFADHHHIGLDPRVAGLLAAG